MFQYEYERPERNYSRTPSTSGRPPSSNCERPRALPPLPRAAICTRAPAKPTVPLRVWVIASASCSAVCAALVLATIAITKWGVDTYAPAPEYYRPPMVQAPLYNPPQQYPVQPRLHKTTTDQSEVSDEDIQFPILEKLSLFKNMVAKNRYDHKRSDLSTKPQIHPVNENIDHQERRIEKKDQSKLGSKPVEVTKTSFAQTIPPFKPALPTLNYEDSYYDEDLYNDYLQSNTMTSYLIEKVQELHDWINSDSDFEAVNNATAKLYKKSPGTQFSQLLTALNESLIDGNVTIVMNKLKDLYFGDNYTAANNTKRVILSNSTDLLSFGILSLDVMLLHNIQLMAWENQEQSRNKMLKDPDVYAFNALFMDPFKVERHDSRQHENIGSYGKRPAIDDTFDLGKNLIENVLEIGMSTARAAIHLGRAYKNTKTLLTQLSNRQDVPNHALQRDSNGNTHALNRLQTSYNKNENGTFYTELDCVWLLYCRNLVATAKLNAPYGVMARINGMALRMLTGELSADRALETMLYEALTGWNELQCNDMFPRCSKVSAASVVMESIMQPARKAQGVNKS